MTATAQDQPALDPLTPNHLAWCLTAAGGSYEWVEVAGQPLGPTDVAIRPRSSALNHMDLWLTRGKPSPPSYPHVAGGDGAGIVIEIGAEVSTVAVGDEVIIDPSIVSADAAQRGYDAPLDRSLQILGEHRWGTHGRRVVVPARNIVRRPANRTWAECAALPVASVTAWRMMRRARVQAGERVLIVGVGGGVSTAAMMVALHLGAEVYVTSSSEAKHEWAIAHGARGACLSSGRFPAIWTLWSKASVRPHGIHRVGRCAPAVGWSSAAEPVDPSLNSTCRACSSSSTRSSDRQWVHHWSSPSWSRPLRMA